MNLVISETLTLRVLDMIAAPWLTHNFAGDYTARTLVKLIGLNQTLKQPYFFLVIACVECKLNYQTVGFETLDCHTATREF